MKRRALGNAMSYINVQGTKPRTAAKQIVKQQHKASRCDVPLTDPQAMQMAQAMSQYRYGTRLPGFN